MFHQHNAHPGHPPPTPPGVRGYLAVKGGLDVPLYLGSRATFPSGQFGGYQVRGGTVLQPHCTAVRFCTSVYNVWVAQYILYCLVDYISMLSFVRNLVIWVSNHIELKSQKSLIWYVLPPPYRGGTCALATPCPWAYRLLTTWPPYRFYCRTLYCHRALVRTASCLLSAGCVLPQPAAFLTFCCCQVPLSHAGSPQLPQAQLRYSQPVPAHQCHIKHMPHVTHRSCDTFWVVHYYCVQPSRGLMV